HSPHARYSRSYFRPPILDAGEYVLWVRAKDPSGNYGLWSAKSVFSVTAAAFGVTATPTQTQLISLSPTPTLSWQASAGGISYDVYLFNGRTAI
ncbi:MAG: hypothetical protein ABGZ24_19920, partial [Fuerstiella sp.]